MTTSNPSDPGRFVAVTGIGMICPLGICTHDCWENMLAGKSGVRKITRFDASRCRTRIAGELPQAYFELEKDAFSKRAYRHSIMPSRLSVLAARQAIENAHLDTASIDRNTAAVITGCGGSTFGDRIVFSSDNRKKFSFSHEMLNALSACVSIDTGFNGPSFNVATACASGATAIAMAYRHVRRSGGVSVAIGLDTMIFEETVDGFSRLLALSENNECPSKASRPFDRNRSGFVLSEGACAVVLESYRHALDRGARIYALISGAAVTSEGYNIIAPEPTGKEMARTMAMAIEDAGLPLDKIGYVNAHGTSTLHNDMAETKAIKLVFGPLAGRLAVSSQKSMIGHGIGAAGAIEFGVTALTLYHQMITPTINYETPDPACDLDYVPNRSRKVSGLGAAITNSFGFGGQNCCLVLENQESACSRM